MKHIDTLERMVETAQRLVIQTEEGGGADALCDAVTRHNALCCALESALRVETHQTERENLAEIARLEARVRELEGAAPSNCSSAS